MGWLVVSSFFFTVPSIYYYNQLYSYYILLLFTSIISANFWRKVTYSWRKYHMMFHFIIMCELFIIIDSMKEIH